MNNKIKRIIPVVAVLLVVLLGLLLIWIFSGDDDIQNSNISNSVNTTIVNVEPGPIEQSCETNSDCEGLCGSNECLIASCSKSGTNSIGECICLDTCTIEGF